MATLAVNDVVRAWNGIDTTDAAAASAAMLTVAMESIQVYGEIAANQSADYYDEARARSGAKLSSRFRAIAARSAPGPQVEAVTNWALGPIWSENPRPDVALSNLAGSTERLVRQPSRETIMQSIANDPIRPRFARSTSGGCPFCLMLASRGAVYLGETAHFESHPHCKCSAVPVFTPDDLPALNRELAEEWDQVAGSEKDQLAAWRKHVEEHRQVTPSPASTVDVPRTETPVPIQAPVDAGTAAGRLTPQQYEAMLPDSTWTEEKRNSILEALRADDNGAILADTLDKFQDGGSIARLRTNIAKRLAGETVDATSARRADAIVDALRHAPTEAAPEKLFRGMSVKGTETNLLKKYPPGETLDLNLTSFTTDRKIATKFQQMTKTKGTNRVMVELIGDDKRLLPIQNMARDRRLFQEKEWVGGGKYEIVESKKSPSGGIIVRIRQIGTL